MSGSDEFWEGGTRRKGNREIKTKDREVRLRERRRERDKE